MEIVIGVDPHKATNVVAAIDEQGELVGQQSFAANRKGLRALQRWAKRFPERRWAVEGAGGIGRPLAQKLLAAGEQVVDIPPKLSSRVRVLSSFAGNARKNDSLDATFTALAALRNDRLAEVLPEDGPEGHTEILKMLTERREDLVAERTRALNRLHVLLRDLLSDPVGKQLSADAAARLLRRARPRHGRPDGSAGGWPPSWCERCVHGTGGLPSSTSASRSRWRLRALPSPRSSAWDRSWRPRSSASWAMWGGSRARRTSPPTRASPRSRRPAGRWSGTGSRSPGTAGSTSSCT